MRLRGIVRAHLLADIAAENPVAEFRSQLVGDWSAVFDRQIGNAPLGGQVKRLIEGVRRTGVDAQTTRPAVLLDRFVELELDVRQQRAKKDKRTDRRKQVGVLAPKAKAGADRRVAFGERTVVHENA